MEISRCHICGEIKRMTFEHIPPKSSGNSAPAKIITGEQIISNGREPWDINGLNYKIFQKGLGKSVLCEHCNNTTGSWYADAYKSFYFQIPFLEVNPPTLEQSLIELKFIEIYPLRVMKQIVCMFMGICGPHLGDRYPEMRRFVLSQEFKQLDFSKYRFSFFIRRGEWRYPQQLAQFVVFRKTELGHINNMVSYIDTPTTEFLFEEKVNGCISNELIGIDLHQLAEDFHYDDRATLQVLVPTYERNSWIPYDIRTREEIMADNDHIE